MQIKVNLQIFLFIIIFIFTKQIEIYGYIMAFTFIHELGHMITGLILRLKPKFLKIMPFGISIIFEDYGYRKLMETKKIIIALAGPLTNILIVILSAIFKFKSIIIYSNVLIALFNLLPIYPLDGGRILNGVLKNTLNNKIANSITNKTSNIVVIMLTAIASISILYLKNIAVLLIIIYLWMILIKENKRYKIKKMMYDILQKNNKCIDI